MKKLSSIIKNKIVIAIIILLSYIVGGISGYVYNNEVNSKQKSQLILASAVLLTSPLLELNKGNSKEAHSFLSQYYKWLLISLVNSPKGTFSQEQYIEFELIDSCI
ncbi:MAG: hypothetical protein JXR78_07710, partial [Victivallales bacterium]|nr:hypothetical protein [Victivallales bacterium]